MSLRIEASGFSAGADIPIRFTGEGEDLSPALLWSGAPSGTKSFSLIVDDPDAPDPAAPKMVWAHWVLYNIPASATGLAEGVGALPTGTSEGLNDWKRTGYRGPLPPVGRHRYFFNLYALDRKLAFEGPPTKHDLERAMRGHVLAHANFMGTYQATRTGPERAAREIPRRRRQP